MLHQLGWLHALDIQYDASTFDTDPFEPQPDGMGTIFPFWVQRPEQQSGKRLEQSAPYPLPLIPLPLDAPRAGYVELPYTLSQDSTLFLVFRRRPRRSGCGSSTGRRARRDGVGQRSSGLCLLRRGSTIHPDLCRGSLLPALGTCPPAVRRCFLATAPREVARCAAQPQPWPATRRPKRVCMVTYSHYETDNRVRRLPRPWPCEAMRWMCSPSRRRMITPASSSLMASAWRVCRASGNLGKTLRSTLRS